MKIGQEHLTWRPIYIYDHILLSSS